MSNPLNHIEMIDAYLTGKLNPEESARLMQSLEQDPALKEEFLLQKDLVHSLQNHRKNELKARLNNIEVGTGYSLPSAVSFKMIAGAAFVALLGTGAYFMYDQLQDNSEETTKKELFVENSEMPTETQDGLAETEQPETMVIPEEAMTESDKPAVMVEEISPEAKKAAPKENEKTPAEVKPAEKASLPTNSEVPADKAAAPVPTAEVVKPEVITFFDEQDLSGNTPEVEVPEDKLKNARKFDTQNIEVTTKTDRRYPFHYMFFENQLSIFGDFSKVPYEVLEVNTGTQTTYFLYHNGNYYELNPNQQKITRLKELADQRIIQELESTRTQKLQH